MTESSDPISAANPYGGSRVVGVLIFIVSLVAVILALVNTPLGEWGTWGYVLGVVVVVFGLTFLYSAAKNRMNIVGRNTSGKSNLIISVVGLIAAIVVVIANFVTQGDAGWTVSTILTTGVFVGLGLMFAAGIPASRAKIADGK
jgi:uncharacterized membrane protein YidH (DUF202 family)